MKRLLSSILALALGLGSVPAQAQVALGRVSLPTGISAPTPVPGGLVPAAGSFAPLLSAPALSVSLAPAPSAPLGEIPLQPLTASAIPVVRVIPVASVLTTAKTETPLETLHVVASPDLAPRPGAAFDGSLTRSAAALVEPPVEPEAAATPRRNFLQRYRDGRGKNPLQNAFGKSMFIATIGAAAAPVLWGAAPAMKFAYAFAFTDLLMLAVILPLTIAIAAWRKLGRAPQTASKPPPSRRAKLAVVVAGALLGIGLSIVPYHATGPAVQHIETYLDRSRTAAEQQHAQWIRGGAVEDETIKALSGNPVGREILDKLRDRGGVLRLPTFFVSNQGDSYASHEDGFDGVYLARQQIEQRGWTVEQFLKDPALQRRLVREMQSIVAHELVHAVQGRRAPWTKGYFKNAVEHEYEAFLNQHYYVYEMVKADPAMTLHGEDGDYLEAPAANLEGFLRERDDLYPKDVHVSEPGFNAFLARVRADMPAHRVDVYLLLAERAVKQNHAGMARIYQDKAKAAAKAAGLPEPAPLVASR